MAISAFHLPPLSTTPLSSSSFKPPFPNPRIPHPWRPSLLLTPSAAPTQPFTPAPTLDPKSRLLSLISDQDRGLKTQQNPSKQAEIIGAIDELAAIGKDTVTTDSSLSGTWRMLWTTEKEQLFIIKNASWFGTQTGDVLQVIDVENGVLNNVITFPPSGVFFVRSTMEPVPPQRVNFRFTSAVLRGDNWEIPLPPFGQGWFESVYLDEDIRVAKDIRGDYLVVDRAPNSWKE